MDPSRVTIIVTTFGSDQWMRLGLQTASKHRDRGARCVTYHEAKARSLGAARNAAVDCHDPQDWICFLDAGDHLSRSYFVEMPDDPSGLALITPQLVEVSATGITQVETFDRNIDEMNPCPIGTLIHREMFEDAGRFWDEPFWEDWSLFRRATLVGGIVVPAPLSHYGAVVAPHSRNRTVRRPRQLHASILRSHERWLNER